VIFNIRLWSYKISGSSCDIKERGLISQYGLKPRGGLVRQLIRYIYLPEVLKPSSVEPFLVKPGALSHRSNAPAKMCVLAQCHRVERRALRPVVPWAPPTVRRATNYR
jgi:hypothetical protein